MAKTLEDTIPIDTFLELTDLVKNSPWRHGWHSNRSFGLPHWNVNYAGTSGFNGIDVSDRIHGTLKTAWNHLQETHFPGARLLRCYANAHTYGVEGYPHQDSNRPNEQTVVIYCNEKWKREWGGETLIYGDDDSIIHAQLPHYNRSLMFDSRQWHCARGVTRVCSELRMTLMYKVALCDFDDVRDQLQIFLQAQGSDQMSHSKNNLTRHLLSVYDKLKNKQQPSWVCQAGGAHSVFGTNSFRRRLLLTPEQRQQLADTIDPQALRVVDLFSHINRPLVLEEWLDNRNKVIVGPDGRPATEEEIHALLSIECANLEDQESLSKHPALKKWWDSI